MCKACKFQKLGTDCKNSKSGYHNLVQSRDLPLSLIEICINCGTKVVFYKQFGDVDQDEYYAYHAPDFAQPGSKMFEKIYGEHGKKTVRETTKMYAGLKNKDQIAKDWDETIKDAKREMKSMNEFGKSTISGG